MNILLPIIHNRLGKEKPEMEKRIYSKIPRKFTKKSFLYYYRTDEVIRTTRTFPVIRTRLEFPIENAYDSLIVSF